MMEFATPENITTQRLMIFNCNSGIKTKNTISKAVEKGPTYLEVSTNQKT